MGEKEMKNGIPIPEGIVPPNCGNHVRGDFGSCGRNLDDLYREKISNSIKIGFESLSNSLVECALILSSEEYAKSLVKEREDKKIEEAKKMEEAKKKDEERMKKLKEDSGKILDLYKEKLKDKIYSMNVSDDKKSEIFNALIANSPSEENLLKYTGREIMQCVKKAFCDAVKEVRPELGILINESMILDPMTLALIGPGIKIPPITFLNLTLSDKLGDTSDSAMRMQFTEQMKGKDLLSLLTNSSSE